MNYAEYLSRLEELRDKKKALSYEYMNAKSEMSLYESNKFLFADNEIVPDLPEIFSLTGKLVHNGSLERIQHTDKDYIASSEQMSSLIEFLETSFSENDIGRITVDINNVFRIQLHSDNWILTISPFYQVKSVDEKTVEFMFTFYLELILPDDYEIFQGHNFMISDRYLSHNEKAMFQRLFNIVCKFYEEHGHEHKAMKV